MEDQGILRSLALSLLVLIGMTAPAMACDDPPPNLVKPKHLLVADAGQIAWARALEPSDPRVSLGLADEAPRFEVIEILKGEVESPFTLSVGRYATLTTSEVEIGDDFDGHRDGKLLSLIYSRQGNTATCEMDPVFVPGESYLIFLDHPHWSAYEIVRSEDDLWLQKVRELVRQEGR